MTAATSPTPTVFGVPLPAPNLLDRVVGYVSPQAGVRRLHARTLLSLSGQFNGARSDRRATKGWGPRAGSPDGDVVGDLKNLRARSRDLYRNAPIAAGAIKTITTSVVGWGLDPQPRIDREVVGLTEEAARKWQRIAKRLWWLWSLSPQCDYANRLRFPRLTSLVFTGQQLSGDIFAIRHFDERRRRQRGDMFATRLQVIEADRVSNPDNLPNTDAMVDGIELDPQTGEVLACHVSARHPGETFGYPAGPWTRVPFLGSGTGQPRVLHLWDPEGRPGLTRGWPLFAPVIEQLRQMTQLSEAQLMVNLVSTLFTVFIKKNGEAESGISATPGLVGTVPGGRPEHRNQVELAPGGIAELEPGEDIQFANPPHPNGEFDGFFKSFCQQFGVAVGLPFELVVKHFTASYSASMAALQEAHRGFRTSRNILELEFCQPAYEMVIEEAVLRGYLTAPGFFEDPMVRMAYCTATWTGPAKGHLNPAQEARAMRERMDSGVTTLEQETAEYSGRDWEENLEQQAMERRMRKAAGLDVETVAERVVSESSQAPMLPPPDDADKADNDDSAEEEE